MERERSGGGERERTGGREEGKKRETEKETEREKLGCKVEHKAFLLLKILFYTIGKAA